MSRWDFQQLDNAARALEDLRRHPGWSVLQDLLNDEIADLDARLDGGTKPLEQAEYALHHGRRGGLKASRDAVATVLEKHAAKRTALEESPEATGTRR